MVRSVAHDERTILSDGSEVPSRCEQCPSRSRGETRYRATVVLDGAKEVENVYICMRCMFALDDKGVLQKCTQLTPRSGRCSS